MKSFRPLSTSDQLAEHLRQAIRNGELTGAMPGIKQLVQTLGVNSVAATKAVQQLEREGLIISQGDRRKRLIAESADTNSHSMRVGILFYDPHNLYRSDALELRQGMTDAGHTPVDAPKTMMELGMDPQRIIRHVKTVDVDAWIIYAGSYELLKWFAEGDIPAFAIYGRLTSVNIAGMAIRRIHLIEGLIKKLVDLGHQRIVLMVREERRKPDYGLPERYFLEQLQANGIQTGPYNIPDWQESPEGLERGLDKLFEHTPPTAMMVGDSVLFHAIQNHLSRRGINAPEDISLISNDYTESFDWARPSIAHIQWDYRPTIRRVMQWLKNVSQGQDDRKRSYTKATFIDGATIGPVPK